MKQFNLIQLFLIFTFSFSYAKEDNLKEDIFLTHLWIDIFISIGFLASLVVVIIIQRNSNRKLSQFINSNIEGIIFFKDRKIVETNEPLQKLFGYTKKELIGKDVLDVVDKKYHKELLENFKNSKKPYEIEMIKKDGTIFPVLVRGTNIGNGKRITAVIDLTELKRTQNQLKELNENLEETICRQVKESREKDRLLSQQSKLAAMGEMINNIAHQWRQPLNEINSIVMALDLELMKKNIKSDVHEEMLNSIEIQTEYMSDTIGNFSKYFAPEKSSTEFFLSEVAENALSILSQGFKLKNIEIEYEVKKDKVLEGFPTELVQVLIILLNNASDALLERGIKDPKISIRIYNSIIVEDNAGGIDSENLSRIFEPYFTTKHKSKGTGVGLYMAKMIIEDSMKGDLEVENSRDGAKFTMSF